MLLALYTSFNFCKDDMMMVNCPKYAVKVEIKIKHILLYWTES